MNNTDTRH